jgi:hypothetical protein
MEDTKIEVGVSSMIKAQPQGSSTIKASIERILEGTEI